MCLKTRKLAAMGLLTAIALTIFMVEAQIVLPIPVPGVKLGLSNIVTVFAVWTLGSWEAALMLAARIFLGAVFAGNFSTILYSAAGGSLAILVTVLFRKLFKNSPLWPAGCLGAAAHSVGQMGAAIAVSGTPGLIIYLPVLIACSIVTGSLTGLCAQLLYERRKDLWKPFSK